jgi:hypothetical protein
VEELYHVDRDDSVVGSVMRDDAHKRGVLHRAGMAFISRRGDKILELSNQTEKIQDP